MYKIGFIGTGNMATAIIKGLQKGERKHKIYANDIDLDKVKALSELDVIVADTQSKIANTCDFIIMAVKPFQFGDILPNLKEDINKDAVIISIAAGVTADFIKECLGYDAKVVTVMPNTPLLVGKGASALAKIAPTSDAEFEFVKEIFALMGHISVIDADKMNYIIPINGSSPAFIYEITKHFVNYAEKSGFDREESLALFCATLEGAAEMMRQNKDLDGLINMVSTKGGTTVAGLEVFKENNLDNIIVEACETCAKRAFELAK